MTQLGTKIVDVDDLNKGYDNDKYDTVNRAEILRDELEVSE
jgi:hypothetical protein